MSWLAQYFLNPGFVVPGLALASIPVIIHILSRLRYKRVRFAAMEFLLQSDELNRRRLILEQLLLLLLRVLCVLLIAVLLARLILDPSRLLMLRGASVHHVVILDDSLSMRDRINNETVFAQATRTMEQMLALGGEQAGAARVTVLLMTDPARPVVSDRRLDGALVQEISTRLRNLQCSWRAVSPVDAITQAYGILSADGGVSPQVHIITDLRTTDWVSRPEVTAALESLHSIDSAVTLIRMTEQSHDNVALEQLASDSLAVARGIPWRMNLTLKNHGNTRVNDLRGSVRVDGATLPAGILIPELEPGARLIVSHDITFQSEGRHQVEVRLTDDLLPEDNRRFIAVDVTDRRPVLIVDDDGQQEDSGYVAAALSADENLTGISVDIRTSQALTSTDLTRYDCVYLLNVRDLPADASVLLAKYVQDGGGIAWFPGDQANTSWYNETLRDPTLNLFPVSLGTVRVPPNGADRRPNATDSDMFQSPVFETHPIFAVYNAPDSPFADSIQMSRWFQVGSDWVPDDRERADGVRTLARLRNGEPVIFEHMSGRGKVLTFLTGAGRRWSNWPIAPAAPGYVVMHLLMHPFLQRPVDDVQQRELAEPLQLQWPVSQFQEQLEVFLPEPEPDDPTAMDTFVRLQATLATPADTAGSPENAEPQLSVTVGQASRPGIYRLKRFRDDGDAVETWMALNVPSTESQLTIADISQITSQQGLEHVRVLDSASAASLGGSEAGRELRWTLLALLIAALIAEQLLSLHMSYHPEGT